MSEEFKVLNGKMMRSGSEGHLDGGVAMQRIWEPRKMLLQSLIAGADEILKSQDKTGRFGNEPWICQDQNRIYPLAAAWAIQDAANPYYRSPETLKAIMDGGDVLIEEADEEGKWTFRKKDNSTWGQTYMPWTYSRWSRAFLLIRDAMQADRRERWEKALRRGFEGIAGTCFDRVHNIPCHHAMGLYAAGIALGREDWKKRAAEFMAKVVAQQSPDGYWSEHFGPVVAYNFVYVEALGVYYGMSKDPAVVEALRKAAVFHSNFVYPDGSLVETIDERNWYHEGVNLGNVGFAFTPEGRGYLARQTELFLRNEKPFHGDGAGARPGWGRPSISESAFEAKRFDADPAATFLLYGETGPGIPVAGERDECSFVLGKGDAAAVREKPWFVCMSALAAAPLKKRWIQDRQNHVSFFHDDIGVFAGGGNTKLQPLLSTFTVGDPSLLKHRQGDTDPDFVPEIDLMWCATAARLIKDGGTTGVELDYGEETCAVRVAPLDAGHLTVTMESSCRTGKRIEAHLPFLRGVGTVRSASGKDARLDEDSFEWSAREAGGSVRIGALEVNMPEGSRLVWPALLHDPYKKDGTSDYKSGRLVLCVPLSAERNRALVKLSVVLSK